MANPYTKGSESITQAEHISPDKTGDNIDAKRVAGYGWTGSAWVRLGANNDGSLVSGSASQAIRTDSATTSNVTYVGKAPIGTATSAASWQVFKVDETTTNTAIITWADGSDSYDNIWDDREILSYS